MGGCEIAAVERTAESSQQVARRVIQKSGSHSRHLAAFFSTLTAAGGAFFAVSVVVFAALLGAPITNFSTQLAILLGILATTGHCSHAQLTDVSAFDAAFGAIV